MYKYIGIRGHRGAGKQTIAYLLGVAIDYYIHHDKSFDGFDEVWSNAIDRVMDDEEFLQEADFSKVFFEGFADTPKIMLAQLLGIPTDWMYDDWCKDSVLINLKDFSFYRCKDKMELAVRSDLCYTAPELNTMSMQNISDNCWVSLRELILYFGKYTMQNMFGRDVWVKSLNANKLDREKFFASNKTIYKIFTDVKFPTEVSYIKEKEGYIVKINRPTNIKEDSELSGALSNDKRIDFEITVKEDLNEIKEDIESITINIIK